MQEKFSLFSNFSFPPKNGGAGFARVSVSYGSQSASVLVALSKISTA